MRLMFSKFPGLDFRDVRVFAVSNVIDDQFRRPLWVGRRRLIAFAIHLIFDAINDEAHRTLFLILASESA
jgi:hypothetical protein